MDKDDVFHGVDRQKFIYRDKWIIKEKKILQEVG
jgi:hypothetical protein